MILVSWIQVVLSAGGGGRLDLRSSHAMTCARGMKNFFSCVPVHVERRNLPVCVSFLVHVFSQSSKALHPRAILYGTTVLYREGEKTKTKNTYLVFSGARNVVVI
jgi:hypothetical protein